MNDGGPAFPALDVEHFPAGYGHGEHDEVTGRIGMSLRDYFAAKALPVAWAIECERPTGRYVEGGMEPTYAGAASRAYFFADAMLKAREQS